MRQSDLLDTAMALLAEVRDEHLKPESYQHVQAPIPTPGPIRRLCDRIDAVRAEYDRQRLHAVSLQALKKYGGGRKSAST